jgi:hypothetical protein
MNFLKNVFFSPKNYSQFGVIAHQIFNFFKKVLLPESARFYAFIYAFLYGTPCN